MLNIGIIGSGFIGCTHAAAANNSDKVNLVAIADVNEEAGKKAADDHKCKWYADAEEMLKAEDIDIVDICLPTFLHEKFVLLAAKYNKNILCEKPVALSSESFDRMRKAEEDAGVKFMVAQVIRFWPEYVNIKKHYDAGEFGDIKMVYAARLAQHPTWTTWHRDPEKSGGGLFDLLLHDVDFARFIFGEAKSVYAIGWQSETGCWNHVISNITFKNGVKACIEGAFDMTENYPFTMIFRIVGDGKSVDYNLSAGLNLEDVASAKRQEVIFETGKAPEFEQVNQDEDAYQTEIDYFADCVENGKECDLVPLDQSADVVRIMLAIKESLETGKVIEL